MCFNYESIKNPITSLVCWRVIILLMGELPFAPVHVANQTCISNCFNHLSGFANFFCPHGWHRKQLIFNEQQSGETGCFRWWSNSNRLCFAYLQLYPSVFCGEYSLCLGNQRKSVIPKPCNDYMGAIWSLNNHPVPFVEDQSSGWIYHMIYNISTYVIWLTPKFLT